MNKIILKNTKNIRYLEFPLPTDNGVYLLVGSNGSGKTTLLICMDRICNSLAFANGFKNTSTWDKADQFTNAEIKYQIDEQNITFRKKVERWVATPKPNSGQFLKNFNYSETIFIQADSKRIDTKPDDLRAGNLIPADGSVKSSLNTLFETNKYNNLMRLKNANGRGRLATYFYVIKDGNQYYSEKRFSTGELALVRLVEKMHTVADNALVLLDEAELALHPRVQVKLLEYLKLKATEKHLTVFVSTHSPTMIKATNKDYIYLLKEKTNTTMEILTPCYPATAIGDVDFENSTIFDYIFFVEDDMARTVLKHMLNRYIIIEPQNATALCNIIPVGGFAQTAQMAVNTYRRIFAQSKVIAIVDQDAFDDLDHKPIFSHLLNTYPQLIKGFGFTPENWLIEQIENSSTTLREKIRNEFHIEIPTIISNVEYIGCNSTKPRQLAKDKFKVVTDMLCDTSGNSNEITTDSIIKIIVQELTPGQIKGILNPVFR